jgi:hypothetical protein
MVFKIFPKMLSTVKNDLRLECALGKLLKPSRMMNSFICVHIAEVTRPKTGPFVAPTRGIQRAMRSGLGLPTSTLTTCDTTPVRERDRITGRNLSIGITPQYNGLITAQATVMPIPP